MKSGSAILLILLSLFYARTTHSSEWPPEGPSWETDLSKAFEMARQNNKIIFAYVGNEG